MKKFIGFQHGIDFGGWLSQGEYTKEHLDGFIKEADFAKVAEWGLDHVRVPVDYNIFEDDNGGYIESGFDYVHMAAECCKKYGLNMILDLHKTAGFSFDSGERESGFFDNEGYQERFYRLWEQFANRFGQYKDFMAFELLNEVTDKSFIDAWNRISNVCVKRIRGICPDVYILIGSYWNNSVEAVKDLDAPYDDHIVYNFHCYDPMIFTHQTASWVDKMVPDINVPYPADTAVYADIQHSKLPGFVQSYDKLPFAFFDSKYFVMRFAEAVKVAEERDVPLYCGEYGVIEKAGPQDTANWFRDISIAFEKFGIGRAAWSYKGVDFGISDSHLDGVREEIIKYL